MAVKSMYNSVWFATIITNISLVVQFFLLTSYSVTASDVISFGIVTTSSSQNTIINKTLDIILTLYWNHSIYQCTVYPSKSSTYYGCNTVNNSTFECNSSILPASTTYGLQIHNAHWSNIDIDQIIVNDTGSNNLTIIEYFNNSDTMEIGYDGAGSFQSRLAIIDLNNPSSAIEITVDYDNPNFCYQCTPVGIAEDTIITPKYGAGSDWIGLTNIDINQGRVYGINHWGVESASNYPGMKIEGFKSDKQTAFNIEYGWLGEVHIEFCDAFTLEDNDYINGYQIIYYEGHRVAGITFFTKCGQIYQCISSHNLASNFVISENIVYSNYYLSGFYVTSGGVLDALGFQFTANTDGEYDRECTDNLVVNTPYYGGTNSSLIDNTNLGKINSISSWGILSYQSNECYQCLTDVTIEVENNSKLSEISRVSTSSTIIGCSPFEIDSDDYINGYRIIWKEHVYGIYLYTFKGESFSCIDNNVVDNIDDYLDTRKVIKNGYYLSGFKWYIDAGIDGISLQFTKLDSLPPTTPPSTNPSSTPSTNPSTSPSLSPSVNPSTTPSSPTPLVPSKPTTTANVAALHDATAYPTTVTRLASTSKFTSTSTSSFSTTTLASSSTSPNSQFIIPESFTSNDKMTWHEAELYCQNNFNSNLISIHSQSEYQSLVNTVSMYPNMFWIGLHLTSSNPLTFEWSDGTEFNFGNNISGGVYPWNYLSGSGIGAPNNIKGDEDCVRLWYEHEYYWDDVDCYSEFFPICKNTSIVSNATNPSSKSSSSTTIHPSSSVSSTTPYPSSTSSPNKTTTNLSQISSKSTFKPSSSKTATSYKSTSTSIIITCCIFAVLIGVAVSCCSFRLGVTMEVERVESRARDETILDITGAKYPLKTDESLRSPLSSDDSLKPKACSPHQFVNDAVDLKIGQKDVSLNIEGYNQNNVARRVARLTNILNVKSPGRVSVDNENSNNDHDNGPENSLKLTESDENIMKGIGQTSGLDLNDIDSSSSSGDEMYQVYPNTKTTAMTSQQGSGAV